MYFIYLVSSRGAGSVFSILGCYEAVSRSPFLDRIDDRGSDQRDHAQPQEPLQHGTSLQVALDHPVGDHDITITHRVSYST